MKGIGGKGVLALSLVLGIATSYMVYQYVDQAGQAAKPVATVPVLEAAKDIPPRTVVTNDMLRVAQVPVTVKLPLAISAPTDADGKITKLPITTGEQVLVNKLFGDREASGLAFVVPPGKRAVAIGVNEVVGSGGLIVPGDTVDVVAVVDTKSGSQTQSQPVDPRSIAALGPPKAEVAAVAQYILQNVEVLAVAQDIEGDASPPTTTQQAASAVGPKGSPSPAAQAAKTQPAAHTVTLAVIPLDAEKLVLAEDKGRIRLVLRPHGDPAVMKVDDALFTTIGGAAALKTEPSPL